jgi:ComF family protein
MPIKNKIKTLYQNILNTLFPISCLGCNKPDTWLCDNCLSKIKFNNQPLLPSTPETKNLDRLISACHYKDSLLQKVIPAYKYKFATELAKPLSQILIQTLEKFDLLTNTILIPVPLHKKRFNERGFNQAELLAKNLGQHFNLKVETRLIIRVKNTDHQARLDRQARLSNLDQAFKCLKPTLVTNKNIILIDDVSTTGSTLNKIAGILKNAGAKIIWGLVVAHE